MKPTSSIAHIVHEFDLESFLTQNKHVNASTFLLRNKGNTNELNWLLAEQLNIYSKAWHKLPQFVENHCWFTAKSYEQASGQASAIFKSSLFSGNRLLDLSGGLGVDDWAFSQRFDQVVSLDPDIELNNLVRINFKKLQKNNIQRLDLTAEEYLVQPSTQHFDLIYLDADRRINETRNFFLDQGAPNFLAIQERCFQLSDAILLKLSPMVDLSYLVQTLPKLSKIIVVGDKTEVKELLCLLHKEHVGEPIVEAVVLLEDQPAFRFEGMTSSEIKGVKENTYLFEPHPVIIKAGLSATYAKHCFLEQLSAQSFLYVGAQVPPNFMGRSFQLLQAFEFSKSALQKYIQTNSLNQVNITRRNFKQSVEDIRKTFKLKEGGKDYLFFSTLSNGTRMVYHGIKLS
ncbi:MAG: hypothetical protein CFE21_13615 [Bacteroidetes bacterium B1(2017)]|nr:MAG: hypothetical protein CFE21_13615 [Bacteroidetes bacterium B1(2017)]